MSKVFFIDFDGTITKKDTCAVMVEAFARDGWEDINRLWETKELSTEECANMTFKLFDADINDIKNLMDTIEIDDYFKEFLDKCSEKGYEVYILSDGYDFNIETILKRYSINVPYYSNRLLYSPETGFKIECQNNNPSCGKCGTCKTNLIKELKNEDDTVIYIGDGYSDTCAVGKADQVFAKSSLYKYCADNGINAVSFSNFKDIINSCFYI